MGYLLLQTFTFIILFMTTGVIRMIQCRRTSSDRCGGGGGACRVHIVIDVIISDITIAYYYRYCAILMLIFLLLFLLLYGHCVYTTMILYGFSIVAKYGI